MKSEDENGELQDDDESSLWWPFEQYQAQDDSKSSKYTSKWTHDYVMELIFHSFPWCEPHGHKNNGYNDGNSVYNLRLNKELCQEGCNRVTNYFTDHQSKDYWERLLYNSKKKKKASNKRKTIWSQAYLKVLPLNKSSTNKPVALIEDKEELTSNDQISYSNGMEREQEMYNLVFTSDDESENEEFDKIENECDPIYSRFAVIRNVFHTSEDGIVFYCQKELDRYKTKMAQMEDLLESELKQIKNQHDQLRAKRAEQRKLLSDGMDSSHDQDSHEEESTETDALNSDNSRQRSSSKPERKSAIFSSIHDAFSYARTGIQGMFVKTSPNASRKVRTNGDDSEEESDEEDTKISDVNFSTKTSAPLLDNHDEFTRQMTSEGGLKYQSSDKSVQQVSYQNLPPPLSLSSLSDNVSSKS